MEAVYLFEILTLVTFLS